MVPVYAQIRKRARQIATQFPQPDFYSDCAEDFERSQNIFETETVLEDLKAYLTHQLEDDFGHGLGHATKVALDAGALMIVEGRKNGYSRQLIRRSVVIVQSAGLLHDVKRKHAHHSVQGAAFASRLLERYPFSSEETEKIRVAIYNHEAFKKSIPTSGRKGALVSDCLYDADKFRWGPDNFKDTIWEMVLFHSPPLSKFIAHYPRGMESLLKIRNTFRSETIKRNKDRI
jgi:hypothetical protein